MSWDSRSPFYYISLPDIILEVIVSVHKQKELHVQYLVSVHTHIHVKQVLGMF